MKKVLLLTVVLMLSATMAFAQAGRLGLFADPTGAVESCAITDAAPGLLPIYVVHIGTTAATASQFLAPKPDCMVGGTWLSDTGVFPVTIGDSQNGVAIGYGQCLSGPIHCLTINIFAGGTSTACCVYEIVGDPNTETGLIEVVDCDKNLLNADGQSGVINADATCACVDIVPAQATSWGKIKSIFE